jgi:hypothetical protein
MCILNPRVRIGHRSRAGANPSAEGVSEDLDEGVIQVNNVIHSFQLEKTEFDKKTYLTYIKQYMKAISEKLKENNPDRVDIFQKAAVAYVKGIVANVKNYEFYTGASMNPEGMVALLNYRVSCVPTIPKKSDPTSLSQQGGRHYPCVPFPHYFLIWR